MRQEGPWFFQGIQTPTTPLKKAPGEGTGPTTHADSRGIMVGHVHSRVEEEVFERAAGPCPREVERKERRAGQGAVRGIEEHADAVARSDCSRQTRAVEAFVGEAFLAAWRSSLRCLRLLKNS